MINSGEKWEENTWQSRPSWKKKNLKRWENYTYVWIKLDIFHDITFIWIIKYKYWNVNLINDYKMVIDRFFTFDTSAFAI